MRTPGNARLIRTLDPAMREADDAWFVRARATWTDMLRAKLESSDLLEPATAGILREAKAHWKT
jgi:hypothetical protein